MSVKRHSNGLTEQENIIHKSLSASQNVGVKRKTQPLRWLYEFCYLFTYVVASEEGICTTWSWNWNRNLLRRSDADLGSYKLRYPSRSSLTCLEFSCTVELLQCSSKLYTNVWDVIMRRSLCTFIVKVVKESIANSSLWYSADHGFKVDPPPLPKPGILISSLLLANTFAGR